MRKGQQTRNEPYSKFSNCSYDKLNYPIRDWYIAEIPKQTAHDPDVYRLQRSAACVKGIQDGKKQGYMRRTYTASYVSTPENDPKCRFISHVSQLCPRNFMHASSVSSSLPEGYYSDYDGDGETFIGFVFQITGKTPRDPKFVDARTEDDHGYDHGMFSERWLAGVYHSDWDGATIWLENYSNSEDAARTADHHARVEAERCCEENKKYREEQHQQDVRDALKKKRKHCLGLIKDYKQEREGIMLSLRNTILDSIWDEVREICALRKEIAKF